MAVQHGTDRGLLDGIGRKADPREKLLVYEQVCGRVVRSEAARSPLEALPVQAAVALPVARRGKNPAQFVRGCRDLGADAAQGFWRRSVDATSYQQLVGREVEIEPGARVALQPCGREHRSRVRLVGILVLGEADIAVDAVDRLARVDAVPGRVLFDREADFQHQLEQRAPHELFVVRLAGLEPVSVVVLPQLAQELAGLGLEAGKCEFHSSMMRDRPARAAPYNWELRLVSETHPELARSLGAVEGLRLDERVPLSRHTRFAIGGPADLFGLASTPRALAEASRAARAAQVPCYLLGDGSNVVAADDGFRGLVLRYTAADLSYVDGAVEAAAGGSLQALVDLTVDHGLAGMHTLERIPGSVGGAVYGNAGAYGHQIDEFVQSVDFLDGHEVRSFGPAECEFEYRESIFKRRKDWLILGVRLVLPPGDAAALRARAREIRTIRDEKFPPAMRCAGSIFKNLFLDSLPAAAAEIVPERAVRAGKVASAFFLEQVGAKGMRNGGIEIAPYHANLIYNLGGGTATQIHELVQELKRRVRDRFDFEVEEEVQYVG